MWLLKTRPSEYGYEELNTDGGAVWAGVTVYHTGEPRAAVGQAKVTRAACPDPEARDPRRVVVDLVPVRRLPAVPLSTIKAARCFAGGPLLRHGRLGVAPLTREQWRALGGRP